MVPFIADSIDELYKKICRGVYPPISKTFSTDLSGLIKSMIQIDPTKRPSCSEILAMPMIRDRMKKLGLISEAEASLPAYLPIHRPFRASTVHQILTPYNGDLLK
jgi:serine/threonine protein kinase